jgi:thiamine biosynthesis lipoprotein
MASLQTCTRFEALGSIAVVAVTDPAALAGARATVERVLAEFDRACSRFRDDSELMAVNAAAGDAVRVSSLLLDAVAAAIRAAELTGGDVDPTVGQALIALGYDRDFDLIARGAGDGGLLARGAGDGGLIARGTGAPTPPPVRATTAPCWRNVQVNRVAGTVRVARGVRLDLGATAKAMAADHAAAQASEAVGCGVQVSLGGDIALGGEAPPGGWRVRVTDDHRSDERAPGQYVALHAGGLATSSITTRRWRTGAGPAHHLVDPATGQPAAGAWRTVSVTAASCLDANIASTAAIIRGETALFWLESLGLPSRLVGVGGVARHVAGWPAEGDDLAPAADPSSTDAPAPDPTARSDRLPPAADQPPHSDRRDLPAPPPAEGAPA